MKEQRRNRLGTALLVSAVVHIGVVGGVWRLSSNVEAIPPMRVYAVNIVSPPPQESGDPSPDPPVPETPETEPEPEPEAPEPEPEAPEPEPPPRQQPAPAPRQQPPRDPTPEPPPRRPEPTPEREPERPARQPEPQPSTGDRPDPNSTGGDDINLELRGVQCPTPDYCSNIIRQINRYFRSPGGNGVADVFFVINRDGSISDLRLQDSSGSTSFRLAVMEAVEQAGINKAFGRLPDAFRADRLPVSFYFRPAR